MFIPNRATTMVTREVVMVTPDGHEVVREVKTPRWTGAATSVWFFMGQSYTRLTSCLEAVCNHLKEHEVINSIPRIMWLKSEGLLFFYGGLFHHLQMSDRGGLWKWEYTEAGKTRRFIRYEDVDYTTKSKVLKTKYAHFVGDSRISQWHDYGLNQ